MVSKEVSQVLHAFDEIISEYETDHQIVFDDESERRKEHYLALASRFRSWNQQKRCIYRDCSNMSVKRSHTIQKSDALKSIAIASRVLTPKFNWETGEIELAEMGIKKASTFPGFCQVHESIFGEYERNKNISCEKGIIFQIYRSICREIVRIRHEIEWYDESIHQYEGLRDQKIKIKIQNKIGMGNKCKLGRIQFESDPVVVPIQNHLKTQRGILAELESQHLSEIENCIAGYDSASLATVLIRIGVQIPVALSGMGTFHVAKDNQHNRVVAILLVLPGEKTTTIAIHGRSQDTGGIHTYLSRLSNSFDILNMIEEWMIRGTDHWFLSPNVWNRKTDENRRIIMNEILNRDKNLANELEFSIFDDIREAIITNSEKEHGKDSEINNILERERAKLLRNDLRASDE